MRVCYVYLRLYLMYEVWGAFISSLFGAGALMLRENVIQIRVFDQNLSRCKGRRAYS